MVVRALLAVAALSWGSALAQAQSQTDEEKMEKALAEAQARFDKMEAKADKLTLRMLEDLSDRKAERRKAAAEYLGVREEPAAVPGLVGLLGDPETDVRRTAASALWRIGRPEAEVAKPALERLLSSDPSGSVRTTAAGALWALGADKKNLIPRLETVLSDKSPYVAVRAADLLLDMGVAPVRVMPSYDKAMASRDAALREYAVKLLVEHEGTPPAFVPLLLGALRDPEESVRILAVIEISLLEAPSSDVIDALRVATRDSSQYVRSTALEAVGRVAPDAGSAPSPVVTDLLRGLSDKKTDVRVGAAQGLGEAKASSPEVVEALTNALGDKKNEVREAAAGALESIGSPAGRPAIERLWAIWNDPGQHWTVRHAAGRALGALGETVDWSSEGG